MSGRMPVPAGGSKGGSDGTNARRAGAAPTGTVGCALNQPGEQAFLHFANQF
jgi:hypothetical protein